MTIDDEVIKALEEAIAIVTADLQWCNAARADDLARDEEVRSGTGVGTPPKPWSGRFRGDTGISITDCSAIEAELQRLEEELARARRGELPTDPGFIPESTANEKAAVRQAAWKDDEQLRQRQKMAKFYRNYGVALDRLSHTFAAGAAAMGVTTGIMVGTGVAAPGAVAPAAFTGLFATGAVATSLAADHVKSLADDFETTP